MKTHTFTLILSGVAKITPELAEALYAATKGDIELNQRDGVAFVEFERTASTLREAITVAIREVANGRMWTCASCAWNRKPLMSLPRSMPISWE